MAIPNPDDIKKALISTFKTLADNQTWIVEWPNKVLVPPADGTWFRFTILPGIPEAAAIGDDAPDTHIGVVQVSIFTPKDKGDGAARTAVSLIQGTFPRGGSAASGTANVRFEKSYDLPAITEEKFYHTPVRIEYRTIL